MLALSIKPGTNVDVLSPEILKELDLILVMSVEPGFGGQSFMPNSLDKIKKLKQIKETNNYKFDIQIDGGINETTSKLAKDAGASNLVAEVIYLKSMTTTQESKHSLIAKVNYEKTISLDGNKLTINDIKLLKSDVLVEISPLAKKKMIKANEYVKEIV